MTITLRPNQVEAADAVEAAFRRGVLRPLVAACVGSGKSLTIAELARREIERGGRCIIGAHTRELVQQNAEACRSLGLQVGINAAALGERTWRAPVISAAIQSIYRSAQSFGPITMLLPDECHLLPHSETGMYRELHRTLNYCRMPGFTGTDFRLQGGSLVQGEGAPFDEVVYRYSILDGIRDGYLVPAFTAPADDKVDVSKLRTKAGEFTGDSQDVQMLALMDSHIAQMVHHGAKRRAWLCFEASTKSAHAMAARLNEWGIPTGVVLGETPAGQRMAIIEAFRRGRLRCLVNVNALTTGFDVQEVDMLVMRRRTKSLGLYIQMVGRLLRTIGGNIMASIAAGKADGLVLDFAGNVDAHGPLDFLRPKDTIARMVSCDCGARVPVAAVQCWSCKEPMTKLCPACLEAVAKGTLDCPHCAHDMRAGPREEGKGPKLLDTPSGAALIASYRTGVERQGGWLPVLRAWQDEATGEAIMRSAESQCSVGKPLSDFVRTARWFRLDDAGAVVALLVPNGASRTNAVQISADGRSLVVPLPSVEVAA